MNNTCFMIQPFDNDVFDGRYYEIFKPAIEANAKGLEVYRVDQDPNVSVPIKAIHNGIHDSVLCLADITTDNPNVWYEVGYAMALSKNIILICSDERKNKYPFDFFTHDLLPVVTPNVDL